MLGMSDLLPLPPSLDLTDRKILYELEKDSLKMLPRIDQLGIFLSEVAARWEKDIAATKEARASAPSEQVQSTTKKAPRTKNLTKKQAKFMDRKIRQAKKKPLSKDDKIAIANLVLEHPEHSLLFYVLLKNVKI